MGCRTTLLCCLSLACGACPLAAPTPGGGYACLADEDCADLDARFVCRVPSGEQGGVCVMPTGPRDAGAADAGLLDGGFDAGAPCTLAPVTGLPFEVCADGEDNDSDDVVDEEPCWDERVIQISARDDLPAGYALAFSFDHKGLVETGRSLSDGSDVKIYDVAGAAPVELPRVADPDASWRGPFTTLWFRTARAQSGTTFEHRLYTGPADADPLDDEDAVFHFADFFDRADDEALGGDWRVTADGPQQVAVRRGSMYFAVTDNAKNRPVVDHDFAPLTGRFAFAIGFDWRRALTSETLYRVQLQLRDAAEVAPDAGPEVPPASGDEVYGARAGPSLVWSGPGDGLSAHETLAWQGPAGLNEIGRMRGRSRIEGRGNLDLATYDLYLNGGLVVEDAVFANPLPELDQLRVMTWEVLSDAFAPRELRFVFVRRVVQREPEVRQRSLDDACFQLGLPPG